MREEAVSVAPAVASDADGEALPITQPLRAVRSAMPTPVATLAPDSAPPPAVTVARPHTWTLARPWRERSAATLMTFVTLLAAFVFAPQQPGSSVYLSAATQARADYRYDVALADYAQASAASPADPGPRCASGQVYRLQGLPQQAAAAYRACAALAPDDGAAWLGLGDALAQTGDDSGAATAWQRAGAAGDWDGYARLAQRAEGQSQLAEAAHWWSLMPQTNELAQGRLGLLALAQGDTTSARARFASLLGSSSAYATQLRQSGVFLYAAESAASARADENIGYALLTLGEPGVALTPLRRAAQLAPHDGSAHAYYGWTLWLLGQRTAARAEIAAGLRYSPTLPFALYATGELALADGKAAVALAEFQSALAITPGNPALWSAAGDAALVKADYFTAELSYGNAAQDSNDPAYAIALIRFYLEHGLGLGAAQDLQIAFTQAKRFPTSEPLIFLEGQIYDRLGQQTNAYYLFQQAVALVPTDPGPWFYLGQYAAASGDVVPAEVELRTALALQPDGPYATQARQALARISP